MSPGDGQGVIRPDFRLSGLGLGGRTTLGAASVCVADEIGKICSKTSPGFVAPQSRPVKDPASAFKHDRDPIRTSVTAAQHSAWTCTTPMPVPAHPNYAICIPT